MDAAPKEKEIIQSAEQPTQDLHQVVSGHLNQAGYKVTPQSVNPADQSPLKKIENALSNVTGDVVHVVGSGFEKHVVGASDTVHVRATGGKAPVAELKKMLQKRSRMGKAA